jgi:type I restriction enzyme R subunit
VIKHPFAIFPRMGASSVNFDFLEKDEPRPVRLARLAERYFHDDPAGALIKLRQFAELMAKEVAARQGALPSGQPTFDDLLRSLRIRSVLPREVADLFYHLKRLGNAAAHEDIGTASEALNALKIARQAAIWFHRSYGGHPSFKAGPFVPPAQPIDPTPDLVKEIEQLRSLVAKSGDAEAQAKLEAQEAFAQIEDLRSEREFWQRYAVETEASLKGAEAALESIQKQAETRPPHQLELLSNLATVEAQKIDLDEAATRALIDGQLRAAGWKADTLLYRHANGTRPKSGEAIAIAEWPSETGPADYALFIDQRCVGVIEAKKGATDVPGRLGQAKRYARDIVLTADELPEGGPWPAGLDRFRVPFVFATNGRPYVKQLATKSGIWFWNARTPEASPHALSDWFSPRDLTERLEQEIGETSAAVAERELGVSGLRPYQNEAIAAVEKAINEGQRSILLAMATGTGKTRLAIALMFELLRAKRFRRILFLVDRNALGRQTLDAMSTTDTSGFLKFDQVFPVADLAPAARHDARALSPSSDIRHVHLTMTWQASHDVCGTAVADGVIAARASSSVRGRAK